MPCLLESEQIYIFNRVGYLPVLVLRIALVRERNSALIAREALRLNCPSRMAMQTARLVKIFAVQDRA